MNRLVIVIAVTALVLVAPALGSAHGVAGHGGAPAHGGFAGHPGFVGHRGFVRDHRGFVTVEPGFGWWPAHPYVATAPAYWYYCPSAASYYPYVGSCPEPWVAVPAG